MAELPGGAGPSTDATAHLTDLSESELTASRATELQNLGTMERARVKLLASPVAGGVVVRVVLVRQAKRWKRLAPAPLLCEPFCQTDVRQGRMLLAACCWFELGEESAQSTLDAMATLALAAVVRPPGSTGQTGRPKTTHPKGASKQPRQGNHQQGKAGATAKTPRPADQTRAKAPPAPPPAPPTKTYEEMLRNFQKNKDELTAAAPLPEYYPSSRPGLLPLRCRTELSEDKTEDKLRVTLSWLAAVARELGKETGESRHSVIDSVWQTRCRTFVERLRMLRARQAAELQGRRRTHRATAAINYADDIPVAPVRRYKRRFSEGPLSPSGPGRASASCCRVGIQYQTNLPPLRAARPTAMSEWESRWLEGRMDLDALAGPSSSFGDQAQALDPLTRRALGLRTTGDAGMAGWQAFQVTIFAQGLAILGRDFDSIAQALATASQPHLTISEREEVGAQALRAFANGNSEEIAKLKSGSTWVRSLIAFYYDVWKVKGCEQAKQWYALKGAGPQEHGSSNQTVAPAIKKSSGKPLEPTKGKRSRNSSPEVAKGKRPRSLEAPSRPPVTAATIPPAAARTSPRDPRKNVTNLLSNLKHIARHPTTADVKVPEVKFLNRTAKAARTYCNSGRFPKPAVAAPEAAAAVQPPPTLHEAAAVAPGPPVASSPSVAAQETAAAAPPLPAQPAPSAAQAAASPPASVPSVSATAVPQQAAALMPGAQPATAPAVPTQLATPAAAQQPQGTGLSSLPAATTVPAHPAITAAPAQPGVATTAVSAQVPSGALAAAVLPNKARPLSGQEPTASAHAVSDEVINGSSPQQQLVLFHKRHISFQAQIAEGIPDTAALCRLQQAMALAVGQSSRMPASDREAVLEAVRQLQTETRQ